MQAQVTFRIAGAFLFFALALPNVASGQANVPANAKPIDRTSLQPRFHRIDKLSPQIKTAFQTEGSSQAQGAQGAVRTVPHWTGSFTYNGTIYPYVMVGGAPQRGGTTQIKTQLIPINFVLDGCLDANGNAVVFAVDNVIANTLNSPNFVRADYETGDTQYADAFQRAEFHAVAKEDWHTLIRSPAFLTPVTMEVAPESSVCLYIPPNGQPFGAVNINFFASELETILQLEPASPTELPIALSKDVVLYFPPDPLAPGACCVLGFHGNGAPLFFVGSVAQTFAWASWLTAADDFGPGWADVLPLSHEIGEWINDPFLTNIVPLWLFPGTTSCGGNLLEVGDPVEVLADPSFPVTVDGYTYHPQTLATLQWFSRQTPSNAIDHAYSFPGVNQLTSPSQPCP
jgi:chitinase